MMIFLGSWSVKIANCEIIVSLVSQRVLDHLRRIIQKFFCYCIVLCVFMLTSVKPLSSSIKIFAWG